MAIQRWDPVRDLMGLKERLNDMFEDVLARSGVDRELETTARHGWRPAMDLVEEPTRYLVRVDLPGVSPSEVEIEIEENALHLRGERRVDQAAARESFLRAERPHGRFALSMQLPPTVDRGGIQAQHRDGVLEIVLPRRTAIGPSRVRVDVS